MVCVELKEKDGVTNLIVNDKVIIEGCTLEHFGGFICALDFLGVYYEVNKLNTYGNFEKEEFLRETSKHLQ